MARDLCGGDRPYLVQRDGRWVMARPIDIRTYVTPDFDESYNPCHYWALRKRFVLPRLKRKYGDRISEPAVQERFARYNRRPPSFAREVMTAHFGARGTPPQKEQFLEAFGQEPANGVCSPDTLLGTAR